MKKLLIILTISLYCFCSSAQQKILIVATNTDTVNNMANGTFLREIAVPFQYFVDHGYEVDVVSPKGGKIPIYERFDTTAAILKTINSSVFIDKTSNTIRPKHVDAKEYVAVFYPGGYGQFWDVATDPEILVITAAIAENGGLVGACGHGTASLVHVNLGTGEYFVAGKTLTCFPSWFEKQVMKDADYGQLLPFDMEEELVVRGANLQKCTREHKMKYVIVDTIHNLVTGAFADDSHFVAVEMVKLLQDNNNR